MKIKKHKGFTLVEMLIVIVIIGILAAALIPRLSSARGRANDVGIKTAASQVATALLVYQMDNGTFPIAPNGTGLGRLSGNLAQGGLDKMPKNTATTNCSGAGTATTINGDYLYISIDSNRHFVIMACPETAGGANYIYCSGAQNILSTTTLDVVNNRTCNSIEKTSSICSSTTNGGACKYTGDNQLRYIYAY